MGLGDDGGEELIMSPCGSCGGKKAGSGVAYLITFRGGEPQRTVNTMGEVRETLANSTQGGTYRIVAKPTK